MIDIDKFFKFDHVGGIFLILLLGSHAASIGLADHEVQFINERKPGVMKLLKGLEACGDIRQLYK